MQFDDHCSYHLYRILVKNRNKFQKRMAEHGIETGTHYKPIHTFSLYKSKIKLKNLSQSTYLGIASRLAKS